jgi:hypothetical protein
VFSCSLQNLLQYGDVIVAWWLDRLGHSMQHLVNMIAKLKERHHVRQLGRSVLNPCKCQELHISQVGASAQVASCLWMHVESSTLDVHFLNGGIRGQPARVIPVIYETVPRDHVLAWANT